MHEISPAALRAYTSLRHDVIGMIKGTPCRVLDVGCSNGVLLRYMKQVMGAEYTVGIEVNTELAKKARRNADRVVVADLDTFSADELGGVRFDTVVLADVLEHTKDPDRVLREVLFAAEPGAQVIVSLPNVQHWTAIWNLLIGRWPQRERGLFDKTHLRFFTRDSVLKLAIPNGLSLELMIRNMRFFDAPTRRANRYACCFDFWPCSPFFTYQYVCRFRCCVPVTMNSHGPQ